MKKHVFIHLILFGCLSVCFGQQRTLDSLRELRALSKNENLNKTIRLNHAKAAQQLAYKLDIDSVTINTNFCLADALWANRLFLDYKRLCHKSLKLAIKTKDSLSLVKLHIRLGGYYRIKTHLSDSALYHFYISKKVATQIKYTFGEARALYNIAIIQKNHKDLAASEANSFRALSILKTLPKSKEVNKITALNFNTLGTINVIIKKYNDAILYYEQGLSIQNINYYNKSILKNNTAKAYSEVGNYSKALLLFNEVLDNEKLSKHHPSLYALIIANKAQTLIIQKKFTSAIVLYYKAKNILRRTEYYSINLYKQLSEYHHYFKHKDSAKYYAYKAKDIAEKYYKDDLLETLLTLTKVEDDSIAVKHYDAYIKLSDSLLQVERLNRNKFARIQFETDTYIEENEKLEERNTLISVFSIIAIVILLLLFVIANQIAKNQKLKFEQAQQQANADIYNLMLNEQNKVQEGRLNERYHIAEELHDGVLNTLAGTRMGIEYLSTLHPEAIKKYELYITELQKTERDIRNLSHSLKHSKLDAQQGFTSIVTSYCDNTSKLHRFECNITEQQDIDWESITDLTKVNLFRILQEALHNVAKHANASTVNISFNLYDNEKLQITITDNGNGFDTSQKAEGIGLQNIQSRCERLRGQCEISAVIGKGTTLKVNLPV